MRRETRFHPAALLSAVRGRWRALFDRRAVETELAEELRFHLEMEVEKNLRSGMGPAEARREALLALGGLDRVIEAQRDARGTRLLEETVADVRQAVRSLARAPAFVAVSVATLATALATGTVIFTAMSGFFYRPLPVPGGTDLVAIFTSDYDGPERLGASSWADVLDFADAAAPVAEVAGEGRVMLGIGEDDDVVMAQGAIVSPGYFRMLRVTPALGSYPGTAAATFPAIVLSHTIWRRTFGSDTSLIGRTVLVNGQPFSVIAVASPGFRGTSREIADDFWIDGAFAPLVMPRQDIVRSRSSRLFHVLARLRDGGSIEVLDTRLDAVASRLARSDPDTWLDDTGSGRVVTTMLEREAHLAGIPASQLLLIVVGVVALGLGLLAIASANLASMQMARGASRRRELATRLALGAGRGRVIRQLLAESSLIVMLGAVVGVIVAVIVSRLVSHYRPIPLPSIDLMLDWRAFAFIGGGLVLALLVFGLLPALQTVRSDLVTDLKGGNPAGAGGLRVGGVRGGLIVTQVALSVMFSALSGMVAFALVRNATVGREDARSVLIARVNFLPAAGDATGVGALTDQLIDGIAAIPGVQSASAAEFIPVRGTRRTVGAEIRDADGEAKHFVLDANAVGPAYFRVVGLALLRGRDFEPRDARAADPVIIVSRAMADALWPSEDPVGRRITIELRRRTASAEVIGIVADPTGERPGTAESFPGMLYLPMRPVAEAEVVLHIRAPGGQNDIAGRIMRQLRAESTRLAAPEVMTLDRYYDRVVLPQRLIGRASGVLAILQLVLAVAGLSGLVAYVTAHRAREIGIRTALGASRRSVLRLVMRQGVRLTAIGIGIGVALSLAASRIVALSLPLTPSLVVGALLIAAPTFAATGAIAMWLPAIRAFKVEPAAALTAE